MSQRGKRAFSIRSQMGVSDAVHPKDCFFFFFYKYGML